MGARVGTPLLRCAALAQFLRKHAHGAVRPSYAGLCAGAPCFAACCRRGTHGAGRGAAHRAVALASAVTLQATLGVATLLHQAPLAPAPAPPALAPGVPALPVVPAQRRPREPTQVGVAARDAAMRQWGQVT